MPTPRGNESEQSFVSYCIPYLYKEKQKPKSASHAAAKCHGIYQQHKKKGLLKYKKKGD